MVLSSLVTKAKDRIWKFVLDGWMDVDDVETKEERIMSTSRLCCDNTATQQRCFQMMRSG